ncbi:MULTISPECIES: hypothetical protein [Caldimonas]|uniref:hypothetical protein n=1 Tax=Caldimonas TaxID=196013 RepID=UPI00036F7A92|nr:MULTISPECIES: hypothetical protein [Caldimonas]GIX24615.1 MAG: hypothetical protein KatS3mg122_1846 [Caldimonas sp.]
MSASPSESDRLAIAAHLHVLLRRKVGRVTDPEWMAANWDYAQEIIRVCRRQPDEELQSWADKLERAMQPQRPRALAMPPRPAWERQPDEPLARSAPEVVQQRYVGRLR